MPLRLLLCASLAFAVPARALANNLRRAPGTPNLPPGGFSVPAADAAQPDLVPLAAPTGPLELSPGTVETPVATAVPPADAAAQEAVARQGHSARNVDVAAAPTADSQEKPALA